MDATDLEDARRAHPLWAVLPVAARARYVGRAAVALLDELDELAPRLAEETGWPRSQLLLSELLPAARGLRALAEDGPRALADTRLTPRAALLAGRSTRVVQSPVGLVGVRGPSASPFAEPLLETAAALLAGNAVVLTAVVPRLRAIFLRAGVPGELLVHAPEDADLDAVCRRVVDLPRPGRRGMLLVLAGAPRERVVEAALWAGFGRHPAAAGRLVMVRDAVPGLVAALEEAAAALKVGDPREPDTDIARPATADTATSPRPSVLVVEPDDPRFLAPTDEPTLVVVETPDVEAAIELAVREARDAPVSIWARDLAKGERIARRIASPAAWVGRHGIATTAVPVRIARHAVPRQLEWRAAWAPGTPKLPADQDLLAAQRTLTEVRHGREARRWPALKVGARALVRAARRER
ncbi:aldehyde dehydrogenase family protein [Solirubrobacter sp. CPCC 204708]|uniref:Aldehyde dehydrogenase family protein n=1 Tax=Solirubrobacter deserti TaxID=2282478 RepID=A0ABT4RBU4_9ACTN|nr:aldehyde dehydrogenase family protein [Solirubrobacter deserti]MBE2317100.1 aldehyde dehydrogenase family protein [Solirubrobacter deserti]MDA0136008.1 aldehyde dehydrogenase family protein [Solirubrobacter deserti]